MSEPKPGEQYQTNSATADEPLLILYMGRRQAMLVELAYIEDYLIQRGRLRRRSVPSRQELKQRGIATKVE